MGLVVGDAARDELAVALDERPGVGLPELERVGRLDVEVGVDEHGRRAGARDGAAPRRPRAAARRAPGSRRCPRPHGSARRPTRPHGERRRRAPGRRSPTGSRSARRARRPALVRRDHAGDRSGCPRGQATAVGRTEARGYQPGSSGAVGLLDRHGAGERGRPRAARLADARAVGAVVGAAEEVEQPAAPAAAPLPPVGAVAASGRSHATSRTLAASASARSFFRLWCSIWRIRSRVTLNARPTSSSVRGCWPSRP